MVLPWLPDSLVIAFSPLALAFQVGAPVAFPRAREMRGQQGSQIICPDPLVCGVGRREDDAGLGKRGNLVTLGRDVCFLSAPCLVLPTQWVCHGHCGRGQDSPPLPIWVVFPRLGLQRQQICLKIGPSRSPRPG